MLLEKTQAFADGKFDVANVPGATIEEDYINKRSDAWEKIEEMNITSRILSTRASVAGPIRCMADACA
jgi:amphiphysin